jgi:two-component system sensor histidine kinase DesK
MAGGEGVSSQPAEGAGGREDSRAPVRGLWFDGRPRGFARTTGAFVWLAFIIFPAVNAFAKHGTALDRALTIAGAVAFVVVYIALILLWRARHLDRVLSILFALLVALAIALTLSDANSWGFLFTYCAAAAGLISRRYGFWGVIGCTVLAGVTSAIGGANGGQVIGWVASTAGIGMLILVMRDLRIRNEELSRARAELARMAVAEERERFARDLHDLLGHSLSVIALKAELAGRLLPARANEAAGEIAELEEVARGALSEVRDAVSGYRQPTLDGELAGHRFHPNPSPTRRSTNCGAITSCFAEIRKASTDNAYFGRLIAYFRWETKPVAADRARARSSPASSEPKGHRPGARRPREVILPRTVGTTSHGRWEAPRPEPG